VKVCPRCAELYPDDVGTCPRDESTLRTVLDPLIGKTVGGRFRLIQRLGSGGMSSVYLARHVLIDRLMAIKTLRRDLARDAVQRDRFLREARAVNRINHENIVEITDFGETEDGLVYLVMEYVPGEPLLAHFAKGPFPAARALDIAEQSASALARAHQMGVIHRDLKPENILLVERREGKGDFVKILDFGIAKILDAPSLTGSQQIFGTPGYIAPEYIQSSEIDGRADLYSLGCILYEMVTGALPFDYEYPGDLLVKHVTEPPIKPSVRHPLIEPAIEEFILRALAKDPAQRFRDAFHFIAELRLVRERLGGPETWGGMNDVEVRNAVPTEPEAARRTQSDALLRGMARALIAETAPGGEAADAVPDGELPEVVIVRDTPPEGLIPTPPALDGPMTARAIEENVAAASDPGTPAPHHRNRDGLVGTVRWRHRFDAIRAHLDEIEIHEPAPPEVAHAMAFSARTLDELEEAVSTAQAYQEAVEALHERARDFRSTLGRALDEIAAKLSEERGVFDALAARRNALRADREAARIKLRRGAGNEGQADALLWELAAVEEELRACGQTCDDLEAHSGELTRELEARNEQFELERGRLVRVLDAQMLRLEAMAAALRRPLELAEAHVRGQWTHEGGIHDTPH
jgi:tRNA A-37 threonylcarbamoyl transferase component Bud32